jgi:hypothetical protein
LDRTLRTMSRDRRRIAIPDGPVRRQGAEKPVEVSDTFGSFRPVARILSAEWPSDTFPVLWCLMRLRSVVGVRRSAAENGEKRIAHRSRSATAACRPQTEARLSCGPRQIAARDERAICAAARAWSRGRRGDRQPVEWSRSRVGHVPTSFSGPNPCRTRLLSRP